MKKAKQGGKLSLSRETLGLLEAPELGRAVGGTLTLTDCVSCFATHRMICCP